MDGLTVDAGQPLMMSVSDIARAKGVSKEAVSKRVKRFEADGLLQTEMRGQHKLVPLAEYDRLVGETTDFGRVRRPAEAPASRRSTADDPVRAIEDARRARYQADREEIELKKLLGEIVLTADVVRSMTRCAEVMVRVIDALPRFAEEIAAAVAKDGVPGARGVLKQMAYEQRAKLAEELRLVGAAADAEPTDEE
jgi:DNA-binding Lrp family transcriptional regulator